MKLSRLLMVLALAGGYLLLPTAVRAQQLFPIDLNGLFDEDEDGNIAIIKGVDRRSVGKQNADTVRRAIAKGRLVVTGPAEAGLVARGDGGASESGPNRQVNDPATDRIISFPGLTRPFELSTQSETSIVRVGQNVVVGYNSSAGENVVRVGNALFATQILFSGVAVSNDGGLSWKSGFVPPPPGSVLTFGDPALAADRRGTIYYSSLAGDASGNTVVGVTKSSDSGLNWTPMGIVATDEGADKNWMAIGKDPLVPARDNLYVTWTRFTNTGSQLMLSRSVDGGASWTTRVLFAPVDTPVLSSSIQFSNPVVDASSGRLYIPFLHFSNIDADALRVLVSDDGGQTFRLLSFNQPGAPDASSFMVVTPGELTDCGQNNGGLRLVLRQGADLGGGRFGLARYRFATRLVTQPAAAADRGRLFIALQRSTSPLYGDPSAQSEIVVLYSKNGGDGWELFNLAPATPAEPQHIHPAATLSQNGNRLTVAFYTQQADSKLRTDVATLHVDGNKLRLEGRNNLSSTSFDLVPSNNPLPLASNPYFTTNYDRVIRACYNLGEYMSITAGLNGEGVVAAWGDNRRTWTPPPGSVFPTPHAQADVFFAPVGDN